MARWDDAAQAQHDARVRRADVARTELVEALTQASDLLAELEDLQSYPGARNDPRLQTARSKLEEVAFWSSVKLRPECEAENCHNTHDVVQCWLDTGKFSMRILACFYCRQRLQALDMLTVIRREDRPGNP